VPVAVVLLTVDAQQTNKVAETLATIPGVTEVYSVAGNFDLVAITRVSDNEALADLVTEQIRSVPGIKSSQTLIAFRTYSKYDLESLFGVD
jgi:DNA-binding Lrp family transcriptional regulator